MFVAYVKMQAKKVPKKIKARARQKARPLYTRPADVAKLKQTEELYAQFQMRNRSTANKSEYDRLTGLIHSVTPGLRGPLVAERNKLL